MSMPAILDIDILSETKETMGAKFSRILQYFLEDSATYIDGVREGVAASDAGRILEPAHTLKSSARLMGAMRLSELARTAEALARENMDAGAHDMRPFAELLSELETAFSETRDAMSKFAPE